MNKEQFKKSISTLINHYIGGALQYNENARIAQADQDEIMLKMIDTQVTALNYAFDSAINELVEQAFPQDSTEWQGESEVNVSEVSGE